MMSTLFKVSQSVVGRPLLPLIPELCSFSLPSQCGVNKTCFHYACLLTWKEKQDHCPACYGPLYYEEVPQVTEAAPYEAGPYEAPAPTAAEAAEAVAAAVAAAPAEEGEVAEDDEVEAFS